MAHYDPIYGPLLTSKEVANRTGFTLNQLRNHRQRPEVSPFPFIRQGGTSWYREDDINIWLEENGGVEYEYVKTPNAKSAPLRNVLKDSKHREYLDKLANITSRNAWSKWYGFFVDQSGWKGNPYDDSREWMTYYWKLKENEDLRELYPKLTDFNQMRTKDPFRYWPAMTYAMRKAVSEINGWGATDEEILQAPVGEVPPSKLD
jgi:hypothetical protein